MRPLDFSLDLILGSTLPLTEMSTMNLPEGRGRLACKADNLTAICEPNVQKMWEPQCLTTLWAFTACYRDSFTVLLMISTCVQSCMWDYHWAGLQTFTCTGPWAPVTGVDEPIKPCAWHGGLVHIFQSIWTQTQKPLPFPHCETVFSINGVELSGYAVSVRYYPIRK
jgi:hypothetical protein